VITEQSWWKRRLHATYMIDNMSVDYLANYNTSKASWQNNT